MKMVEKILRLIDDRNLSQAEVERLCGLSSARITKWKDGVGEPTATQIMRIADLLKVPIRYLVDDSLATPEAEVSATQRRILELAELVGYDVALRRIAMVGHETQSPLGAEGRPGAAKTTIIRNDKPKESARPKRTG
jgi:transcriptional regulator with XRE-family HTH domain